MSGEKIRKDKRNKLLHPTKIYTTVDGNQYEMKIPITYPNKGAYIKNNLPKRHIENPNIYEGESPISCAFRNIRLPKKGRKTAWKRFRKNFPYVKVTKSGGKRFDEQKFKEFYDSRRSKKKI